MGQFDITNASTSDLTNAQDDYSVSPMETDGPTGAHETEYINENWSQYLGYYKTIPEIRAVIDAKARWSVGKGFKARDALMFIISGMTGLGKEGLNTILENMIRTYHIGGDAFAEIIRDEEGTLTNLKVLDPGTIKIIANKEGKIIRYEQVSKTNPKADPEKFKPEEIFHLMRNRVADEIHGISLVEALEKIILSRNEAMDDMKILMHRHVKPIFIFHLDTDVPSEIASFKAEQDAAFAEGENIYVPKDAVVPEVLAVAANATLNPLPWIQQLDMYFYQVANVPKVIVGGSNEMTEATAKIVYYAFEQTVSEEQMYLMEQCNMQLGMDIQLEFPATLQNDLISDKNKSESMQATTPEDTSITNVGVGPNSSRP